MGLFVNVTWSKKLSLVFCLLLSLGLAACGSPSVTPSPTTSITTSSAATTAPVASTSPAITTAAPPLPSAELLDKASQTFSALQSYYLKLEIRQGKLQVKGLDVKQAEGSLQAPDRFDVKVKVAIAFVEFDVPVIGLDGQQYMKDDFGNWNASKPDEKLDLPGLFDTRSGMGPTLAKLRDSQYLGTETVNGVSTFHIQGSLAGADIGGITLDKLGSKDVTAEVWLEASTYRLLQLSLKETGPDPANWVYTFSKFNDPVTIQKPSVK